MDRFFYIIILFLVVLAMPVKAQDPQFTQFYSVPLYLSPSFAGATQQHRVASVYRDQWTGIPGGFVTYAFSYDHYFSNFNSGIGVIFLRDYAGSGRLGTSEIMVEYAYDIQFLESWHLRPGLGFDYEMYNVDFNKLIFSDQISSIGVADKSIETAPSDQLRGNLDASSSLLVYSDRIWNGFTVDHLFKPNNEFYGEQVITPIKYTFFGGATIMRKGRLLRPIDESVSIAYLFTKQADYMQLDAGVYWYKSPIIVGLWYRGIPVVNSKLGDALSVLLGFKNGTFTIGYSYDFTISNLINSSQGAHELSVIYEFTTAHRKRIHAIPCPEF